MYRPNVEAPKENIAAISGLIHSAANFPTFYESLRDSVGGFPGIWAFALEAAEAYSFAERRICNPHDYEYIDAIDRYVDLLKEYVEEEGYPSRIELLEFASMAICASLEGY